MPELPDVESYRNYFNSTSLNQKIQDVAVENNKVLDNISSSVLTDRLKSRKFSTSLRHGKYLFAPIGRNLFLMLHFGMTGFLEYFKDEEQEPRHTRVTITFTNGYHLTFVCQRMLGKVSIIDSVDNFIRQNKLGPDAADIDLDAFRSGIKRSRAAAKTTLMNQSFMAGIGNIYSDEILFQAGVHPKTSANKLSDKQIRDLHRAMKRILNVSVNKQADPEKLPRSYILPHRKKGLKCPRCSTPIKDIKVTGRTAYFCPRCQPGSSKT